MSTRGSAAALEGAACGRKVTTDGPEAQPLAAIPARTMVAAALDLRVRRRTGVTVRRCLQRCGLLGVFTAGAPFVPDPTAHLTLAWAPPGRMSGAAILQSYPCRRLRTCR